MFHISLGNACTVVSRMSQYDITRENVYKHYKKYVYRKKPRGAVMDIVKRQTDPYDRAMKDEE